MKRPKVTFYQDNSGQWRWRLQAANGRIVATGESHKRRADAERSFTAAWSCIGDAKRRHWLESWGFKDDL